MSRLFLPYDSVTRLAIIFPVVVIAAFQVGRGVGNVALLFYLIYAIYMAIRYPSRPPGWFWILVAYILAPLLSLLFYGGDIQVGLYSWVRFSFSVVATFVVGLYLPKKIVVESRTAKILLLLSVVSLLAYASRAAYFFIAGDFMPSVQLNGLHVSALLPLALIAIGGRWRLVIGYVGITLAVLLVGNSRTEIMMLLVGVAVAATFYRKHLALLFLAPPVAYLLAMAYGAVLRGYNGFFSMDVFSMLNSMTGGRLILWGFAVSHPPENSLFGVGIGQSPLHMESWGYQPSFHNAFVETWYDGGWLWLGLLGIVFIVLLREIGGQYRRLVGADRWVYSCFFGAFCAAATACMMDRGYGTALFNVFMFYCLFAINRHNGKTD